MRTLRTEASRGYGGCRHASNYRSRSIVAKRHRGYQYYRYRRYEGFIVNIFRIIIMCLIIGAVSAFSINMLITKINDIPKRVLETESNYGTYILPSTDIMTASHVIPIAVNTTMKQLVSENIIDLSISSTKSVNDIVDDTLITEIDNESIVTASLGNNVIGISNGILRRFDLPDVYYPGIDFSSFQPYMDYRCITNKNSPAYKISHSDQAYTDDYGMRRFSITENQFTVDNQDDYVIALGTFYKEKGIAGSRYLIITTTGMYTAITGDEKSDAHTDSRHMFSLHQDGSCAGIVEWIVDQKKLESTMKRAGTITAGPIEALKGEILYIYGIQ